MEVVSQATYKFIVAHAMSSLIHLGNSVRISALIGFERAYDAGLVSGTPDRNEDGYIASEEDKQWIVDLVSHLLADERYLNDVVEAYPDIVSADDIKQVEAHLSDS